VLGALASTVRRSGPGAPTPWALYALGAGSILLAWIGLLPHPVPGIRKGHEVLTVLAVAAVVLGVVGLALPGAVRACRRVDRSPRHRWLTEALAGLAILPIVLVSVAQAYVFFVRPELPWVGLAWRAQGVPVYLSVAFWEWTTCALLSVDLAGLGLVLGPPA